MRGVSYTWPMALLTSALVVVAAGCGGASDVDRASYVARNIELLSNFPTPPGSRLASGARSEPLMSEAGGFGGSYIAGYKTYWSFSTSAGTTATDLATFYRGNLEGWRRANWGRSFATGERSVCYRASLASVCVGWLTNLDRRKGSGLPFQISINSQAYADRDTPPW